MPTPLTPADRPPFDFNQLNRELLANLAHGEADISQATRARWNAAGMRDSFIDAHLHSVLTEIWPAAIKARQAERREARLAELSA